MTNERKLGLIILSILLIALGFGRFFGLSLNSRTFQIGYTVYSDKGEIIKGFLPRAEASEPTSCSTSCPVQNDNFAVECRNQGHKVYTGTCCESLCSGSVTH